MMTAGYRRGYPAISLLLLWSAPEQRLAVPEFADVDRKFHANYQRFLNLHTLHQTRGATSSTSQKHVSNSTDSGPAPKRQRFTNPSASLYPATGANAVNAHMSSAKPSSSGFRVPCPAITDAERMICREFSGCHKCRRLFVDHKSINCPNEFPDGRTYKPLTCEMGIQLATRREWHGLG